MHGRAVRQPRAISGCPRCGGRETGHRARSAGQLGNECEDGSRPAAERRSKMGIVSWIVVGAIAGILAGFLVTGDEGLGIIGRILLGIVGAVVGGFIAGAAHRWRLPHRDQPDHDHRRHDRRGHRRVRLQLLHQQEWIGTRGGLTLPHRDACSARAIGPGADLVRLVARSGHAFTSLSPVNRHALPRRIGGRRHPWSSSSSLPPPTRMAPPPS